MVYIIIIIFVIVLFLILRPKSKKIGELGQHWNHFFSDLQFSSNEFYTLVEEKVKAHDMPDVRMGRVNYAESSIISNKREYLHIERKEDIFDICAAPFGNGFFVSYWLGNPSHKVRDWAMNVPFLGTAVEGWQGTTYFKVDTACMFRSAVVGCIKEAVEEITSQKGLRGLTENEQLAMIK